MNRVVFISVAVFLLVAPVFTAPAEEVPGTPVKQLKENEVTGGTPVKPPKENEVTGDVNRDVETIGSHEMKPDENTETTSSVTGQSTGIITRIGFEGDFKCKNIVCPSGTQTCKYESKMLSDNKNTEVHYKCTSGDGTVLLDQTKTEPVEEITSFDGFMDVSDMFKEMHEFMRKMFGKFPFYDSDEIEQN